MLYLLLPYRFARTLRQAYNDSFSTFTSSWSLIKRKFKYSYVGAPKKQESFGFIFFLILWTIWVLQHKLFHIKVWILIKLHVTIEKVLENKNINAIKSWVFLFSLFIKNLKPIYPMKMVAGKHFAHLLQIKGKEKL